MIFDLRDLTKTVYLGCKRKQISITYRMPPLPTNKSSAYHAKFLNTLTILVTGHVATDLTEEHASNETQGRLAYIRAKP